jgi:hypothetical protein
MLTKYDQIKLRHTCNESLINIKYVPSVLTIDKSWEYSVEKAHTHKMNWLNLPLFSTRYLGKV